jgi:NAD(P)H-dependent flavin oxidoreductase YrpB (nitropropane dioxygenase family)
MWRSPFTREYGLELPFISAGMGFVALPELVAAVSNAGGLGCLVSRLRRHSSCTRWSAGRNRSRRFEFGFLTTTFPQEYATMAEPPRTKRFFATASRRYESNLTYGVHA